MTLMKNHIQALEDHSSAQTSQQLFVLFHGYGADAYDLFALRDAIQTPKPTHWIFPQGVLSVPIGPGWTGRAWWNIDIAALERAMQTGQARDLTENLPPQLPDLRKNLTQYIEQKGYSWDNVILGGFSQGAMLATDLFLHAPQPPKALVILSGALINKTAWSEQLKTKPEGLNIFISHGLSDPILPAKDADRLESMFKNQKAQVEKALFQGGHEIPPSVIAKLNTWLKNIG